MAQLNGSTTAMPYQPIPEPDSQTSLNSLKALLKHRNLLSALRVFHTELGDIFRVKLPGFDTIVLSGPEASRFVLVTARDKFNWRNESDPVTTLLRLGVLVTDGDFHDSLRKNMNAPLHRHALSQYVDMMCQATDWVADQWLPNQATDMLVEMRKIALMILTETLFKVDVAPDLAHLWQPVVKSIAYISPGLWLFSKRLPRWGYTRRLQQMDDYLYQMIRIRRDTLEETPQDLLGLLITSGMDDDLIRDQLLTMLIAGHDTSTALLTWAIYLLTNHPLHLQRVEQEVQEVLGDNPPTIDNIKYLNYLGQVIDEALRMYPPIHLGSRMVTEDIPYKDYLLPAGVRVMYSIYLTHHDPTMWHSPYDFDPTRFSAENKRKIPPYAYLPFGGGPRNCIGAGFALVESKVILARLFQRFTMTFTNHTVRMKMGATLEPAPGVRTIVTPKS